MTASPVSAVAQDIMQDIIQVTALDAGFRQIRTITSADELAMFRELWSAREKQKADVAMRPDYRIAFRLGGRAESWLYDPDGFARVLTKRKTPVYRLPSPAAVNKLLGIDRGSNPTHGGPTP
jgi:hypothetical protein